MAMLAHAYSDLPLRPQLVRNASLITIFLEADPVKVAELLPAELAPRPDGRIILNMWSHSDPNETTGFGGFGSMSVSYLAVEVAGEEGSSSDGSIRFPGRYWVHHWSSFDRAREYALAAAGLAIMAGETIVRIDGDRLTAQLTVEGSVVIAASARIGRERQHTVSGHSIYYAQRPAAGDGTEVAQFEIPWVSDAFDAQSPKVEFSFPQNAPPMLLIRGRRPSIVGVSFRRITLVPYLAQRVINAASG